MKNNHQTECILSTCCKGHCVLLLKPPVLTCTLMVRLQTGAFRVVVDVTKRNYGTRTLKNDSYCANISILHRACRRSTELYPPLYSKNSCGIISDQ